MPAWELPRRRPTLTHDPLPTSCAVRSECRMRRDHSHSTGDPHPGSSADRPPAHGHPQEDRQLETVELMDQGTPPGPPGFGLGTHRPWSFPILSGGTQGPPGSLFFALQSGKARQECSGRQNSAWLAVTASMAQPGSPTQVDAHTLGDDCPALPPPPPGLPARLPDSCGEAQLLTASSCPLCGV